MGVGCGDKGGFELGGRKIHALRQHVMEEFGIESGICPGGSFIVRDRVLSEEDGEH